MWKRRKEDSGKTVAPNFKRTQDHERKNILGGEKNLKAGTKGAFCQVVPMAKKKERICIPPDHKDGSRSKPESSLGEKEVKKMFERRKKGGRKRRGTISGDHKREKDLGVSLSVFS